MKELIELTEARRASRPVPHAVATVLRVEGSSYRRPGARMLVNIHGRVAGSISGGCLEKKVISEAREVILTGKPQILTFDTTDQDDLALGTSLGCQGKIWIGVEYIAANEAWILESVADNVRQERRPAVLMTRVSRSTPFQFDSLAVTDGEMEFGNSYAAEIRAVFSERKTHSFESKTDEVLLEWMAPPISLLLFGGGLDVPPMVQLARDLGHEVTVIDRRPELALPDQFPMAHRVIAAKPHEIAALVQADDRTAAVIMNHHYDTDRDTLAAVLPMGLPYVAMLGPKKRTQRILSELKQASFPLNEMDLSALHAPAGLDLGGENPEQIALAILAELQAALARRSGGKLKHRDAPIHSDGPVRESALCPIPA